MTTEVGTEPRSVVPTKVAERYSFRWFSLATGVNLSRSEPQVERSVVKETVTVELDPRLSL